MEESTAALIGRDGPLADVVAAIRDDRPIAVVGEAGIGKTALARAAIAASRRAAHEGGGFATLSWLPYLAIRRAIDLPAAGEPATVARTVERAVGPDVLFVDDLQWTDAATQEVVALLFGRIAVVVAVREGDPASAPTLAALRDRAVQELRLGGLDDESARQLVRRIKPDVSADRLRNVVVAAGGNPLLIEELSAHGETSSSLARAIVGQLDALSTADRRSLELLAVADRPLPAVALGASARRLQAAGLVHAAGDGLAVRHGLIAQAILASIDDRVGRSLHLRLAELVEDPAERARHLAAGGQRDSAFELATAAAATASDPRNRAMLLQVAAETATTDASSHRVRAGVELAAVGNNLEAIEVLAAPIEGPPELQAMRAAALAGAYSDEGRPEEALAAISEAAALDLPTGSRAATELTVTTATALVNSGRLPEAVDLVERAVAAAGPDGPGYRLAGHLAAVQMYAGRTDRLDSLEAAVAAAVAAGDGSAVAGRSMDLYYMTLAIRGGSAAEAFAVSAGARLDSLGFRTRASQLRAESMQASIFAGNLATTVVQIDGMLEEPLGRLSRQRLLYNRGLALGLLGYVEDADRTLAEVEREATDDFDGRGATLWCWAEASFWAGNAVRSLEQAEASLGYMAYNAAEYVLPALARAWAEVELGREPTPAAVEAPFRCLAGAVPELRGLTALAAGRHAEASAAFDEAAATWAGFHIPRELLCRWAAGEAARRSGVEQPARDRLSAVVSAASAIGFEPLAARARRSLRLAGVHPTTVGTRSRAGGLLTNREREVLRLVERGLTNAEIARRMSLGRPTVARLLSNAMLKLGAESRAQAVVLAAELS